MTVINPDVAATVRDKLSDLAVEIISITQRYEGIDDLITVVKIKSSLAREIAKLESEFDKDLEGQVVILHVKD